MLHLRRGFPLECMLELLLLLLLLLSPLRKALSFRGGTAWQPTGRRLGAGCFGHCP